MGWKKERLLLRGSSSSPSIGLSILLLLLLIPLVYYVIIISIPTTLLQPKGRQEIYNSNNNHSNSTSLLSLPSSSLLSKVIINCQWSPQNDYINNASSVSNCVELVTNDILNSIHNNSNITEKESDDDKLTTTKVPYRWLFFGDSTMWRMFTRSDLINVFRKKPILQSMKGCSYYCRNIHHTRCNLAHSFHMQVKIPSNKPLIGLEGPIKYGYENPGCQDCSGCDSDYVICTESTKQRYQPNDCNEPNYTKQPFMYGGYFSIEFARDVELQTIQYNTTQENSISFLETKFNTPDTSLLQDFGGKPVCVVSTGLHDMAIPNITLATYISNVKWYLSLLHTQCIHIIWLQNTAPAKINDIDNKTIIEQYKQTSVRTKIWNNAVYEMIIQNNNNTTTTNNKIRYHTSIIDVYNASLNYPHVDNVHMNNEWYKLLGNFFVQVANTIID